MDVVCVVVDGFFVGRYVFVVLQNSVLMGWFVLEVGLILLIFLLQEFFIYGLKQWYVLILLYILLFEQFLVQLGIFLRSILIEIYWWFRYILLLLYFVFLRVMVVLGIFMFICKFVFLYVIILLLIG